MKIIVEKKDTYFAIKIIDIGFAIKVFIIYKFVLKISVLGISLLELFTLRIFVSIIFILLMLLKARKYTSNNLEF